MNRIIRTLTPIAALLALAGAPCFAQTPPDAGATLQSHIITIEPQDGASVSSMWSMSSNEDGRSIKLEGRNGVITAEIDGKPVPADHIMREGNTVKIRDDKGEIIYQTEVPGSDPVARVNALTGRALGGTGTPTWSASPRGASPRIGGNLLIESDPPAVMIGVQLLEPDSSLRGHLGLKENETTLIGAIYEGLPAAQAGIEPYDIIVAIDGKTPASPEALRKALRGVEAGKGVSMDVIHHGQKKTVTVTPEKYNREKLDKSKINAIAAATGTPSATAIAGADPDVDQLIKVWKGQPGFAGNPFVAVMPGGKPLTLMNPGAGAWDAKAMAEQMREMATRAQQDAEAARKQAENFRQQLELQLHNQLGPPMPGAPANMQQQMNEMMKKMESMQKMLEQQRDKPKADDKTDGRS